MPEQEQKSNAQKMADGICGARRRWTPPRVIVAEIEDETEAGIPALPEADGGLLS